MPFVPVCFICSFFVVVVPFFGFAGVKKIL